MGSRSRLALQPRWQSRRASHRLETRCRRLRPRAAIRKYYEKTTRSSHLRAQAREDRAAVERHILCRRRAVALSGLRRWRRQGGDGERRAPKSTFGTSRTLIACVACWRDVGHTTSASEVRCRRHSGYARRGRSEDFSLPPPLCGVCRPPPARLMPSSRGTRTVSIAYLVHPVTGRHHARFSAHAFGRPKRWS